MICVDIFRRPDESWGIEEYRRDAEDGIGWFVMGFLSDQRFNSEEEALSAAHDAVPWLKEAL